MSTKDVLIVAATRLLDEGGPDHVTLRAVGGRAGVSHNAPYKHFADKRALLEGVAVAELRRTATLFERAGANPDPAAGLRAAVLAWVSWSVGHPERFRLVYAGDVAGEAVSAQAADTWGLFDGLVARAQQAGALRRGAVPALVDGLRAMMTGAVLLATSAGGAAADGEKAAEQTVSAYLALLTPRT